MSAGCTKLTWFLSKIIYVKSRAVFWNLRQMEPKMAAVFCSSIIYFSQEKIFSPFPWRLIQRSLDFFSLHIQDPHWIKPYIKNRKTKLQKRPTSRHKSPTATSIITMTLAQGRTSWVAFQNAERETSSHSQTGNTRVEEMSIMQTGYVAKLSSQSSGPNLRIIE